MGKNYRFEVSGWGLAMYGLQLFPNLIWMLFPPAKDVLSRNTSPYLVLEILEKAGGVLIAVGLIFLKRVPACHNRRIFLILAVGFLCGYYAAWGCYFAGMTHPWLLIAGLAAIPPLAFSAYAIWLRNYPVLFPCALFAAVHIAITCQTYL